MRAAFGDFVFDSARHRLTHRGKVIHLTPKAFRLLAILIEQSPNAISRRELYDQLWPDTVVEISNLDSLVADVRRALNEAGRQPRFLKTIHAFGFAFINDETREGPIGACRFEIRRGLRAYLLHEGENVIGRESGAAVEIESSTISRRHARIIVGERAAILEDLGSKNGTFVQGRKINAPTELIEGDEIRVGPIRLRFGSMADQPSTRTHHDRRSGQKISRSST